MLQLKKAEPLAPSVPSRNLNPPIAHRTWHCRTLGEHGRATTESSTFETEPQFQLPPPAPVETCAAVLPQPQLNANAEVDALYLFACRMAWESDEDLSAGWELLAATQSSHGDTRAHARALLSSSRSLNGMGICVETASVKKRPPVEETEEDEEMKAPYNIEIIENCAECEVVTSGDFCAFSHIGLESLTQVSQKSVLPAGAILFVEGQAPRGMFIVCSGKVNLSTTSREGKILILKTAGPGEALGLSASVSGMNYETTAETATPCLVNFVERKDFLDLLEAHPEIGMHTAQCLSRDYQSAYRDIHDLVLTRSSVGKLARLLLTQAAHEDQQRGRRRHIPMTHEEMAMRIGASRETVTRLLCDLRKKQLIRLDGPTLVIRDRTALEAMAV